MIRRLGMILSVAFLGCGLAGVSLARAADEPAQQPTASAGGQTAPGGEKSDKEVVIRGESRLKVKVEKPEPDLTFDVDEIAVPYVKTEDYVLDVSPTSIANPAVVITNYLSSSQTASPFIQMFKRPPIMTLRPKYKNRGSIAKWRLRITDGFGNVFKEFGGKSSLPDEIVWDGKGAVNDSEMADVGTSYSYIFSVIDEASNPTSQMGRPLVLESLLYDENGATIAKVTAETMFSKKDRRQLLSQKGELYCRELADILMARQNYPLIIDSYAKDVDAANSNAEIVQEYLMQRYGMPKENFKIIGNKARLEKIVFKVR